MFLTGKERAHEEGKEGERKTEAKTTESERDVSLLSGQMDEWFETSLLNYSETQFPYL